VISWKKPAAAVFACLVALVTAAGPAEGADPGANGEIAFSRDADGDGRYEIWTIAIDGSGLQQVTHPPAGSIDRTPAWSPDGKRIAFARSTGSGSQIWVIEEDGWGEHALTAAPNQNGAPTWSPDGDQIAFDSSRTNNDFSIWVMNADGSNPRRLTDDPGVEEMPDWSPFGDRIVFSAEIGGEPNLWTIRPDGMDLTNLTKTEFRAGFFSPSWSPDAGRIAFDDGSVSVIGADGTNETRLTGDGNFDPAWSPDGTKIAFGHQFTNGDIWTMNPDGSAQAPVAVLAGPDQQPDWQPLPINVYARPKGATPMRISFVMAFEPCATANRMHGEPLAVGSCTPPVQSSQFATVGTLDANGNQAKSVGFAKVFVKPGNAATPEDEADLLLELRIADVRDKGDLIDYAGELGARPLVRITDKDNTPAPGGAGAGTTQDTLLPFTVLCAPTSDAAIGSLCQVVTTAEAVLPGSIKEGLRANWELRQFDIDDGGSDADAATIGDNTRFAAEGIFTP
jgi:TolB protein